MEARSSSGSMNEVIDIIVNNIGIILTSVRFGKYTVCGKGDQSVDVSLETWLEGEGQPFAARLEELKFNLPNILSEAHEDGVQRYVNLIFDIANLIRDRHLHNDARFQENIKQTCKAKVRTFINNLGAEKANFIQLLLGFKDDLHAANHAWERYKLTFTKPHQLSASMRATLPDSVGSTQRTEPDDEESTQPDDDDDDQVPPETEAEAEEEEELGAQEQKSHASAASTDADHEENVLVLNMLKLGKAIRNYYAPSGFKCVCRTKPGELEAPSHSKEILLSRDPDGVIVATLLRGAFESMEHVKKNLGRLVAFLSSDHLAILEKAEGGRDVLLIEEEQVCRIHLLSLNAPNIASHAFRNHPVQHVSQDKLLHRFMKMLKLKFSGLHFDVPLERNVAEPFIESVIDVTRESIREENSAIFITISNPGFQSDHSALVETCRGYFESFVQDNHLATSITLDDRSQERGVLGRFVVSEPDVRRIHMLYETEFRHLLIVPETPVTASSSSSSARFFAKHERPKVTPPKAKRIRREDVAASASGSGCNDDDGDEGYLSCDEALPAASQPEASSSSSSASASTDARAATMSQGRLSK